MRLLRCSLRSLEALTLGNLALIKRSCGGDVVLGLGTVGGVPLSTRVRRAQITVFRNEVVLGSRIPVRHVSAC